MRAEPITTPVKTGWKCIDDRTLTADMLRRDKEAQEAFINALTPRNSVFADGRVKV